MRGDHRKVRKGGSEILQEEGEARAVSDRDITD